MPKYIADDIEISSDDFDREDSDEKNSDEGNSDMEKLMKTILMISQMIHQ